MMYETYKKELLEIRNNSLERKIFPVEKNVGDGKYIFLEGKKYLNLSSNNYLGIAQDKEILERFFQNSDRLYSLGSASSRLLTGNTTIYNELETLLAKLYKKDRALIFNSGYHANVGIFSALLSKKDIVFSDKLNHASIVEGIKLSGADFQRYKHLDYEHLESLLQRYREINENAIIVTESLFSMDGDIADLGKLIELKEKYNAMLIVDEAHAFGVYGENDLGVCEAQDVISKIDLIVGTFGKAIGSTGAFCVGDGVLIDYLINKSRSLIFSTALPEINIAFSYFIIKDILPSIKVRTEDLFNVSRLLREKLSMRGDSYIIPVILGSNQNAVEVSEKLLAQGYYLLPIRHPTVPLNTARIRISMCANIGFEDVEGILLS